MVKLKIITIIMLFISNLVLAADDYSITKVWDTYIPYTNITTKAEAMKWFVGKWNRTGMIKINNKHKDDYDKVKTIEVFDIVGDVSKNAVGGKTLIVFSGTAYGSDESQKYTNNIYYTFGFYAGSFCLGPQVCADIFELRVNNMQKTSSFIIKHRISGDYLKFDKIDKIEGK